MKLILILIVLGWGIQAPGFAQEHIFVFLNSKPYKAELSEHESEELQKTHMANIDRMVADGQMIIAGPFEGGGGIFILKTNKVDEAREWLNSDPAIKANRWNIELFPITFLKGGACLTTEPYEMVVYNFARLYHINDIANYKTNSDNESPWLDLVNKKDILSVGRFPRSDGGIIVYNDNLEGSLIDSKYQDQFEVKLKKVWVAKGSFCEKR
jgi:uncharacterized protein YciI